MATDTPTIWQLKWQRREAAKDNPKKYRLKIKSQAHAVLGGICVKCGLDDPRVLQIDHINRTERGLYWLTAGNTLYNRIIRGIVTKEDVQLLCANCHIIKTIECDDRAVLPWKIRKKSSRLWIRKLPPKRRLKQVLSQ